MERSSPKDQSAVEKGGVKILKSVKRSFRVCTALISKTQPELCSNIEAESRN